MLQPLKIKKVTTDAWKDKHKSKRPKITEDVQGAKDSYCLIRATLGNKKISTKVKVFVLHSDGGS